MRLIAPIVLAALSVAPPLWAQVPPERQAELRTLVTTECVQCHGNNLTGGEGPALLPADIRVRDEDELVRTILSGRDSRMPPWRSRMNADEVRYVIREILSKPR